MPIIIWFKQYRFHSCNNAVNLAEPDIYPRMTADHLRPVLFVPELPPSIWISEHRTYHKRKTKNCDVFSCLRTRVVCKSVLWMIVLIVLSNVQHECYYCSWLFELIFNSYNIFQSHLPQKRLWWRINVRSKMPSLPLNLASTAFFWFSNR